jgi:capsule biosynthesis phosphatase
VANRFTAGWRRRCTALGMLSDAAATQFRLTDKIFLSSRKFYIYYHRRQSGGGPMVTERGKDHDRACRIMKRLVIDLDGTLTIDDQHVGYAEKRPNQAVVDRLREYQLDGFEIIIYTARNMNSFGKSVGKINAVTLPGVIDWLKRHDIPFDEIHVGKPWCGRDGFYVDDRAVRPSEFAALSYAELQRLIGNAH